MIKLAERAKLIFLIRERKITLFVSEWKPLMDFLLKKWKNEVMINVLDDLKEGNSDVNLERVK